MEYRNRSNGELNNQGEIRKMYPNVSLPRVWNQSVCDELGIDPVLITPKPTSSTGLKRVVRDGVEQDVNDNWVQAWKEVDMFSDYTDEDDLLITKASQEQAYLDAELQKAKDAKIAEIDKETSDAITTLASETKQRNYLAKALELSRKERQGTITAEEQTQLTTLENLWSQIETLRTDGNDKEAQVQAATTVAEVEAI